MSIHTCFSQIPRQGDSICVDWGERTYSLSGWTKAFNATIGWNRRGRYIGGRLGSQAYVGNLSEVVEERATGGVVVPEQRVCTRKKALRGVRFNRAGVYLVTSSPSEPERKLGNAKCFTTPWVQDPHSKWRLLSTGGISQLIEFRL